MSSLAQHARYEKVHGQYLRVRHDPALAQHLAALAHFTRNLSNQSHEGAFDLNHAVAGVTLGDLANRLARVTRDAESLASADAGDLDLF